MDERSASIDEGDQEGIKYHVIRADVHVPIIPRRSQTSGVDNKRDRLCRIGYFYQLEENSGDKASGGKLQVQAENLLVERRQMRLLELRRPPTSQRVVNSANTNSAEILQAIATELCDDACLFGSLCTYERLGEREALKALMLKHFLTLDDYFDTHVEEIAQGNERTTPYARLLSTARTLKANVLRDDPVYERLAERHLFASLEPVIQRLEANYANATSNDQMQLLSMFLLCLQLQETRRNVARLTRLLRLFARFTFDDSFNAAATSRLLIGSDGSDMTASTLLLVVDFLRANQRTYHTPHAVHALIWLYRAIHHSNTDSNRLVADSSSLLEQFHIGEWCQAVDDNDDNDDDDEINSVAQDTLDKLRRLMANVDHQRAKLLGLAMSFFAPRVHHYPRILANVNNQRQQDVQQLALVHFMRIKVEHMEPSFNNEFDNCVESDSSSEKNKQTTKKQCADAFAFLIATLGENLAGRGNQAMLAVALGSLFHSLTSRFGKQVDTVLGTLELYLRTYAAAAAQVQESAGGEDDEAMATSRDNEWKKKMTKRLEKEHRRLLNALSEWLQAECGESLVVNTGVVERSRALVESHQNNVNHWHELWHRLRRLSDESTSSSSCFSRFLNLDGEGGGGGGDNVVENDDANDEDRQRLAADANDDEEETNRAEMSGYDLIMRDINSLLAASKRRQRQAAAIVQDSGDPMMSMETDVSQSAASSGASPTMRMANEPKRIKRSQQPHQRLLPSSSSAQAKFKELDDLEEALQVVTKSSSPTEYFGVSNEHEIYARLLEIAATL